MAEHLRRASVAATAAACVTAAVLPGCADQAAQRRSELNELGQALVGRYDNAAQVASDVERGLQPVHAALALLVEPAPAAMIGDAVLYLQEAAADDPRRVVAQRLWSFTVTPDQRIKLSISMLKDPRRWLGAAENPDLLQSLLPGDVVALPGCELIWKKTATGFEADNPRHSCKPPGLSASLFLEQRATLRGTQLALAEQRIGVDSAAAPISEQDLFYRFERRGGGP